MNFHSEFLMIFYDNIVPYLFHFHFPSNCIISQLKVSLHLHEAWRPAILLLGAVFSPLILGCCQYSCHLLSGSSFPTAAHCTLLSAPAPSFARVYTGELSLGSLVNSITGIYVYLARCPLQWLKFSCVYV